MRWHHFASSHCFPAWRDAGVGASAVPSFPPVVTVGASGLEASIELRNTNTDDNAADINTVCNAGDPIAVPDRRARDRR